LTNPFDILYSTYMNSEKPILIVEDEMIQQNYMLTLLKHLGLTADVAGTIHEAMAKLASALTRGSPYKLIFLDIMLPDGTGHDLLVRLRNESSLSEYRDAKVIMFTAMDDLKHISGSFAEESDAYLTKPVSESKLKELLTKEHIL